MILAGMGWLCVHAILTVLITEQCSMSNTVRDDLEISHVGFPRRPTAESRARGSAPGWRAGAGGGWLGGLASRGVTSVDDILAGRGLAFNSVRPDS